MINSIGIITKDLADIELGVLGGGSHGTVHLVNRQGREMARKTALCGRTIAQEAAVYRKLPASPHLVLPLEVTKTAFYSEVMDSDLMQYIDNNKISREDYLYICQEILKGMQELKNSGQVHLDIKGQNILVKKQPDQKLVVKLGDLGKARDIQDKSGQACYGTVSFSAPETIANLEDCLATAADVYSFGVTLFQVLSQGETIFNREYEAPEPLILFLGTSALTKKPVTSREILHDKLTKDNALFPIEEQDKILDLIYDCTRTDPKERPTIDQLNERFSLLK